MPHRKPYDEEIQRLLKSVIDVFDEEDQSVRERQIRTWRRLKLMWEGFRNVYYDEVAHDWRIPNLGSADETNQEYYDKPINVFRAYLESIIAALSVIVPGIKCFPDDADNPLDLLTAKAGDQIGRKIYHDNDISLVWLHALFIYCTEGMVACYNFPETDEKYGQFEENTYEEYPEEHEQTVCPNCGHILEDSIGGIYGKEGGGRGAGGIEPGVAGSITSMAGYSGRMEGIEPGLEGISGPMGGLGGIAGAGGGIGAGAGGVGAVDICPSCGATMMPEIKQMTQFVSRLIKKEMKNKTRQRIEVYGGLSVKIPNYARRQSECPYLCYSYETHFVNAIDKYPHLREKLRGNQQGIYDPYETWGRLSPQYLGEFPRNVVTCRDWWLRPCAFDVLPEEDADKLKKLFPQGASVFMVNDDYAEAYPEELDKCWTLTMNPMSDYLQHDPIGLLLVSVQEITNDLVSLTMQTVEHGIGQTFADPKVLNFDAYRQMETVPGGIYPATPKSGKSLAEGFFEIKTATLSQEVMPFGQSVQQMGQLVSGALPSLFGGAMQEQKTASGYAMSRAQALQRLQNVWKTFTVWWKQVFGKVIPQYIESIQDDEKDVQLDTNGNFINVFIRKADLEGKIGKFGLDANENLPITWAQKKDMLFQLLQSGNPQILQYLGAPENLPIIREALGLTEFYIPGEDDRNKQYEEIKQLLESEPLLLPPDPMMMQMSMMADTAMQDPAMMQPQEVSSVDIEPDIDNHQIEFEICRAWLVSDAGRLAKTEKPGGYRNVLLHAKAHLEFMRQMQMMAAQAMSADGEQSGAEQGAESKESDKPAPIMSEEDVDVQV